MLGLFFTFSWALLRVSCAELLWVKCSGRYLFLFPQTCRNDLVIFPRLVPLQVFQPVSSRSLIKVHCAPCLSYEWLMKLIFFPVFNSDFTKTFQLRRYTLIFVHFKCVECVTLTWYQWKIFSPFLRSRFIFSSFFRVYLVFTIAYKAK